MDRISKEHRSWNMSRIRGSNTKPEVAIRSLLHRLGFRFRLKSQRLPGKPDVVLTRHRIVVFVHGCFWHRHLGCKFCYTPKTRTEFWITKFAENTQRDRVVRNQLRKMGWKVIIVLECELRDVSKLTRRLAAIGSKPVEQQKSNGL